MKVSLENLKRAAPRSFAFLVLIPLVILVLLILAYIYFSQSFFKLPDCLIKQVTGYPCPSCGFTRSFYSLINFKFLMSFKYHPLPILASLFILSFWIHNLLNVFFRKKDMSFPVPFVWYYSILGIVLISWIRQIYITISNH